jgi:hypothetical protein
MLTNLCHWVNKSTEQDPPGYVLQAVSLSETKDLRFVGMERSSGHHQVIKLLEGCLLGFRWFPLYELHVYLGRGFKRVWRSH